MGRQERERAESGILFRDGKLIDASEVVRHVSEKDLQEMHERGEKKLKSLKTNKQIKVLADSLHQGRISAGHLRATLEDGAKKEMKKGVRRLRSKKKEITVDELLKEYRDKKNWELKELAEEVGLDEQWFIAFAQKEIGGINE